VSRAIRCLHARLASALDSEGKPDPGLQAFARHLNEHLLIPSDGGGIQGRFRVGAALPGWFTYQPPKGVVWEVQSPKSKVQSQNHLAAKLPVLLWRPILARATWLALPATRAVARKKQQKKGK